MQILTAIESDIEELAKVEIESKMKSIPDCVGDLKPIIKKESVLTYNKQLHKLI
jgi:hypothetical protein